MTPSTLFIVKRLLFQGVLCSFMVFSIVLSPLCAAAEEDPCGETGMYIGNQTNIDLWYTRAGGACTFWAHDHILILKPGERLAIYQDMTCETAYCSNELTYDDYESLDTDHNCRVKILPDCVLSDM